jgi:hypothetical protein
MATDTLSVNVKTVLGTAFMEVLVGNITDETIAAVDSLQKEDVPANLVDVFHFIRAMSTSATVRESCSRHILGEFYAAAEDVHKAYLEG